jgi:hypothetical protein
MDSGIAADRCNQISMSGIAEARILLGMQIVDHSCGVHNDMVRQLLQI